MFYQADACVARASVPGGQERFEEKKSPLLPPRLPQWQDALDRVDRSRPCADDADRLGLWLPEAEFVVAVSTNKRLYTYLSNWLRFRQAIIKSLLGTNRYVPPRPVHWRTLLSRFPKVGEVPRLDEKGSKKRRVQKEEAWEFFSELLNEKITMHADLPESIFWNGLEIPQDAFEGDSLHQHYVSRVHEVAWELSEIAFRVELYEMDRYLVPAPSQNEDSFEMQRRDILVRIFGDGHPVMPLVPPKPSGSLSATNIRTRAENLEALRTLMCRWPDHPPHFDTLKLDNPALPDSDLSTFERDATLHYCQRFYEWSGRAAVIPRTPPGSQ